MPAYVLGEQYKQRVDNVLSIVESTPSQGGRTLIETRFDTLPQPPAGKTFRICTFTGAWAINATKTVTFRGVTSTPNTVSAVNLFAEIAAPASAANCAIAKDGTAWYLIAAQC